MIIRPYLVAVRLDAPDVVKQRTEHLAINGVRRQLKRTGHSDERINAVPVAVQWKGVVSENDWWERPVLAGEYVDTIEEATRDALSLQEQLPGMNTYPASVLVPWLACRAALPMGEVIIEVNDYAQ